MPIFDNPPIWELGGYDPATWTGHAPVTSIPLADGSFPPEMKPSKVLQIMSESFDDEGDVSTFEVQAGRRMMQTFRRYLPRVPRLIKIFSILSSTT